MPRFTKRIDDHIKKRVLELLSQNDTGPYAQIEKEIKEIPDIPNYTAKQIRQRWKSKLDPNLTSVRDDPLSKEEKKFIIEQVKSATGEISWTDLAVIMKRKFDKLRSDNSLKNFWYSRKRQIDSGNLPSSGGLQSEGPPSSGESSPPPNANGLDLLVCVANFRQKGELDPNLTSVRDDPLSKEKKNLSLNMLEVQLVELVGLLPPENRNRFLMQMG